MTDDPDPKIQLRRLSAQVRAGAARQVGPLAAEALARQRPSLGIAAGAVVAGYWPLGDEIDPRPLMAALAEAGCRLCLPVVVGRERPLEFRAWSLGAALETGPHGTRHPPAQAPVLRPTVVLTPLLAFDRKGFRLGYGGGYYDRTLADLRQRGPVRAIGLAFAAQRVETVKPQAWDQTLDMIMTETGMITVEQE